MGNRSASAIYKSTIVYTIYISPLRMPPQFFSLKYISSLKKKMFRKQFDLDLENLIWKSIESYCSASQNHILPLEIIFGFPKSYFSHSELYFVSQIIRFENGCSAPGNHIFSLKKAIRIEPEKDFRDQKTNRSRWTIFFKKNFSDGF